MRRRRCSYELRLGSSTISTGLLAEVGEFRVGDRVDVTGSTAIVRAVEAVPGKREPRLVLELLPRR